MRSTKKLIIASFLLSFASSTFAQVTKQPPDTGRFYITSKDSAGTRLYYRSRERPILDTSVPFDTARVKRNWSRLRKGMPVSELSALFGGRAGFELDPENGLEYWWYGRRAVVVNSITKKVSYWDK
jgi:hypothetical protein